MKSIPSGPASGLGKVIRGGGIDLDAPYFSRSANRASYAPDFPSAAAREALAALAKSESAGASTSTSSDGSQAAALASFTRTTLNRQGHHSIGFRVVAADLPKTPSRPVEAPFFQQAVKQSTQDAARGPRADQPYFRKRRLLPRPPEHTPIDRLEDNRTAGLHPAILGTITVPVSLSRRTAARSPPTSPRSRRRRRMSRSWRAACAREADEWDMPSLLIDFADANDASPMMWTDGGTVRVYWGSNRLEAGFPFQWIESNDSGATWARRIFRCSRRLSAAIRRGRSRARSAARTARRSSRRMARTRSRCCG